MELSRVYLEIIDTQHTKMLEAQFMAFMQLHSKHYFMTPCTKSDSFLISLRNQGHCRGSTVQIGCNIVSNQIFPCISLGQIYRSPSGACPCVSMSANDSTRIVRGQHFLAGFSLPFIILHARSPTHSRERKADSRTLG